MLLSPINSRKGMQRSRLTFCSLCLWVCSVRTTVLVQITCCYRLFNDWNTTTVDGTKGVFHLIFPLLPPTLLKEIS